MADTNKGLNRAELVKQCNKYAIKYGVDIPVATTDWGDFGKKVKNKRTAMYQNLSAFSGKQQFNIIKEISELPFFLIIVKRRNYINCCWKDIVHIRSVLKV